MLQLTAQIILLKKGDYQLSVGQYEVFTKTKKRDYQVSV